MEHKKLATSISYFYKNYLFSYSGVDMVGILSQLPYVGEKIATSSAGAGASTFMIAYFVHKMMAPIRYVHCN